VCAVRPRNRIDGAGDVFKAAKHISTFLRCRREAAAADELCFSGRETPERKNHVADLEAQMLKRGTTYTCARRSEAPNREGLVDRDEQGQR
jgi:hypothetical protein